MDEREKKELMSSLQRSSIAGTAVLSFFFTFLVLHYIGVRLIYSIPVAVAFSVITTLARSRSRL